MSKSKVFFRLPGRMKGDYNARVLADGYGPRGKSRWVREAIEEFLRHAHWVELCEAQLLAYEGGEARDHVTLGGPDLKILHQGEAQLKSRFAHLEGIRSKLIRAAITARMLHLRSSLHES